MKKGDDCLIAIEGTVERATVDFGLCDICNRYIQKGELYGRAGDGHEGDVYINCIDCLERVREGRG